MEHDKGKELFLDLLNSGMMIAENVDESLKLLTATRFFPNPN